MIASSVKSAGKAPVEAEGADEVLVRSRNNSTNVTRDPHASLSLFAPREKIIQESLPSVVAPRASAKPAPRDLAELFVGSESDNSPASPTKAPSRERSESTTSSKTIAPKVGAGKNYAPSRLFDNDENSPIRPTANKDLFRPNPTKYQHFDIADGSDPQDAPRPTALKDHKSKHGSQWDFDDFNTPAKAVPSKVLRSNDVRHWGSEDNETMDSPIKFKKIDKPRKDAETHFEFQDDGTPDAGQRLVGRPRGAGQNDGLGLYQDHLFPGEDGVSEGAQEPKRLNTITNVKDRRKDFDLHFTMAHDSPASNKQPTEEVSDSRAKAVKMMDANWTSGYDQSPNQKENAPVPASQTRPNTGLNKGSLSENTNQSKGIYVAGDGMGNKKSALSDATQQKGINIGGDGMGGKKGSARQWGFGDDSAGEEEGGINRPSKYRTGKQGIQQATGGDFWDF